MPPIQAVRQRHLQVSAGCLAEQPGDPGAQGVPLWVCCIRTAHPVSPMNYDSTTNTSKSHGLIAKHVVVVVVVDSAERYTRDGAYLHRNEKKARTHAYIQAFNLISTPVCKHEDVTVLWIQEVHTDREITTNRPDIIQGGSYMTGTDCV
jgi:hypothetical protein